MAISFSWSLPTKPEDFPIAVEGRSYSHRLNPHWGQSLLLSVANPNEFTDLTKVTMSQTTQTVVWKLPQLQDSWFEVHFYDRRLGKGFFRKQLHMNRTTFDALTLDSYSIDFPNLQIYAILFHQKSFGEWTLPPWTWQFLWNHWTCNEHWKIDSSWECVRRGWSFMWS